MFYLIVKENICVIKFFNGVEKDISTTMTLMHLITCQLLRACILYIVNTFHIEVMQLEIIQIQVAFWKLHIFEHLFVGVSLLSMTTYMCIL